MELAQSLHLVATAIFVLGSAVVGVRLVLLARRTREQPEMLLGCAILGTAVLGYGVLIAAMILRGSPPQAVASGTVVVLSAVGRSLHALGVTFFFLFVVRVFRMGHTWAWALTGVAMLLLWGGVAWGAVQGSFRTDNTMTPAWWCEYAVIWTYPLWLATESFRYWNMMRRRAALGFADPMVTNRFLLWGLGSVFSALAIWTASVPFFLLDRPELLASAAPRIQVLTAVAGVASVSCSYLAFLPPAWYARQITARA